VPKQFINPPGLNPTAGFTHVVTATDGRTVHVSGQVSVDERGEVVGRGDFRAQVERTFQNLGTALAAAAMLVSLGITVASQTLPNQVLPVVTCVLAGGLAGLVVTRVAAR